MYHNIRLQKNRGGVDMERSLMELLPLLDMFILPTFIYIVKIERRLAHSDTLFQMLDKGCPVINISSDCPKGGEF